MDLTNCHLGRSPSNLLNEAELKFEQPPRLYMAIISPPARATLMVAAALEVPIQLIPVNLMQEEQLQPEYVQKNPQHTVPLLEENDFYLWDSHAIAGYLATAYGRNDSLYPRNPRRKALVDQRLHFDSSVLFPSLRSIAVPVFTGKVKSLPEEGLDQINEAFGFMEKFLEDQAWLAGDNVTIADICCVATVSSINEVVPINSEMYPNISTWFNNCKNLPYYEENNSKGVRMFGEAIKNSLE